MVLLGDEAQVEARFDPFGDSTNLDSRLVHGLHQMYQSQKLLWTYPMVLLGDEAQVEACFGPFGDSANLDATYVLSLRQTTIGSEVVLDAPDGTPR
jgi:hypothetical protein